jgi:hypothetical protein
MYIYVYMYACTHARARVCNVLDKIFITDRVKSYNQNRKEISIKRTILQNRYI